MELAYSLRCLHIALFKNMLDFCKPLWYYKGVPTQITTLEDLYYGNINPVDHSLKQGSSYSEVSGYIDRHKNDLLATLTEQQKEIFEKLRD